MRSVGREPAGSRRRESTRPVYQTARSRVNRDLRFGPVFFLVSHGRVGDATPSPPCCPLARVRRLVVAAPAPPISHLPRAGRPPRRHSRRRQPRSPPGPSARSRGMPRESPNAAENLPKEAPGQVTFSELEDEVPSLPNDSAKAGSHPDAAPRPDGEKDERGEKNGTCISAHQGSGRELGGRSPRRRNVPGPVVGRPRCPGLPLLHQPEAASAMILVRVASTSRATTSRPGVEYRASMAVGLMVASLVMPPSS
jgi:hypothetical protein